MNEILHRRSDTQAADTYTTMLLGKERQEEGEVVGYRFDLDRLPRLRVH